MRAVLDPAHERMLAEVKRHGHFTVGLVAKEKIWENESAHFSIHDSVVAPLLKAASECWAYGLEPKSAVYSAAQRLLEPKQGKFRVRLTGDPVHGHELFWNAIGGKRGSIVIIVTAQRIRQLSVFKYCRNLWVFGNLGAGHTPSALRFAKSMANRADVVNFMLSRNNGIEWLDVLAAPPLAAELYLRAFDEVEKTW